MQVNIGNKAKKRINFKSKGLNYRYIERVLN